MGVYSVLTAEAAKPTPAETTLQLSAIAHGLSAAGMLRF